MRQLIFTTMALVVSAIGVQAAPIACGPFANYGQLLSTLGPDGCQLEDKIYSNFGTPSGTLQVPLNWQVTIEVLDSNPGVQQVDFAQGNGGTQVGPGSVRGVQYDVKVDTTIPGAEQNFITDVGINLNAGSVGSGTLTKTITNMDPLHGSIGALLGVVTTTSGSKVVHLVPPSQWIHVVETVSLNAGSTLSSFTDGYLQTNLGVPEPATYLLTGLGLAALGLIARRKTNKN